MPEPFEWEYVPTDNPIRHIWTRLALLSSIAGAKNFLRRRAAQHGHQCEDSILDKKAQGLAFGIRSAQDYFSIPVSGSLTSACLAYYYGTFSLLKCLLLADTSNMVTLEKIETYTSYGHGLSTFSTEQENFPTSEKLMVLNNGFITRFLQHQGTDIQRLTTERRYKTMQEVRPSDAGKLFAVQDVMARIPELKAVYVEIFHEHPDFVTYEQPTIMVGNIVDVFFPLYANSPLLSPEKIRDVLGWSDTVELKVDADGIRTVASQPASLVEHYRRYESVMTSGCYVKPLLEQDDVLLFDFFLLYCLSIWVRYRPALWREITEGHLDLYRPLINNFLIVVERIVPNIVLDRLYHKQFLFSTMPFLS
jgi:hypothetical protein